MLGFGINTNNYLLDVSIIPKRTTKKYTINQAERKA
jgi:hypothetical protein